MLNIDTVVETIASGGFVPAKASSGETDMQARGLSFNYLRFSSVANCETTSQYAGGLRYAEHKQISIPISTSRTQIGVNCFGRCSFAGRYNLVYFGRDTAIIERRNKSENAPSKTAA